MKIDLNSDYCYWIERMADIESALAMDRFRELCKINPNELNEENKKMHLDCCKEIIELYTFLKELRFKLENARKNGK